MYKALRYESIGENKVKSMKVIAESVVSGLMKMVRCMHQHMERSLQKLLIR